MSAVEPIRDKRKITAIANILRKQNERNYILFLLGISTGARISDILKLKKRNVSDECISVREKKTRKYNKFYFIPTYRDIILGYVSALDDNDYLFPTNHHKPMTRQNAYYIINKASEKVGIKYPVGCHTMRKTFGYWYYKSTKDIATLMLIFKHADEAITLRYIGYNDEAIKTSVNKISF